MQRVIMVKVEDLRALVEGKTRLMCHNMVPYDATFVGCDVSADGTNVLLTYEHPDFIENDRYDAYVDRIGR